MVAAKTKKTTTGTTKTAKTTAKTASKTTSKTTKQTPSLASVIMLFTKSSSHWYGMTEPEIISIADTKFIRGKQVTGKEGHRMEGKMTLVPLEHVASIIEFETEEDLWSESQPKNLPFPVDESRQSAVLTSHEQLTQARPPKKHSAKASRGFNGSHFGNKFKSHAAGYSERNGF